MPTRPRSEASTSTSVWSALLVVEKVGRGLVQAGGTNIQFPAVNERIVLPVLTEMHSADGA